MAAAVSPTFKPADMQRKGVAANAVLTLDKLNNHRRTLTDFFVKDGVSGFSDIKVGNVTLLRIWDNLVQAVLVKGLETRMQKHGFLWYLSQIIPEFPFPTATEDEIISITRDTAADRIDLYYKDQEGGDISNKEVLGGSQAPKQLFVLNMTHLAAITAAGKQVFDKVDLPSGLSFFTDGTRLSANKRFTLYAIAGDFVKNIDTKATNVHIFDERIELFTSEDNTGLVVDDDDESELAFSLAPLKAFVLPTPYIFEPNRLMTLNMDIVRPGANNLTAESQKLFLIGTVETVGGP